MKKPRKKILLALGRHFLRARFANPEAARKMVVEKRGDDAGFFDGAFRLFEVRRGNLFGLLPIFAEMEVAA